MRTPSMILVTCCLIAGLGCEDEVKEDELSADDIEARIDAANHCTDESECVDVGGKCPFGCAIIVNAAEAEQIEQLVDDYDSNCMYDCMALMGIECVDGKCEGIY